MKFGILKKFLITASLALAVGVSASVTACTMETKRPRAKITIEFVKGEATEDFTVEYDLYRNLYPNTVKHFIELSKAGFYDNTVVHDYSSGDWFTGMYSYDGENETNTYASAIAGDSGTVSEYFSAHSKENRYLELFNNGTITPTVYANTDFKKDKNGNVLFYDKNGKAVSGDTVGATSKREISATYAMPSLIGEFYNNTQQDIKNGKQLATAGCLKMFYYPAAAADNASNSKVFVVPPFNGNKVVQADSKYNGATSAFGIQVGTSTNSENNYCVFGRVRNEDNLNDLKEAVAKYFEDTYGTTSSSYTVKSSDVDVTVYEPIADGKTPADGKYYNSKQIEMQFNAPKAAIVLKKVEIVKN